MSPIFKLNSIFIVLFLALLCVGCDPGYRLKPVGWQPASDYTWAKNFGDFEIQTRGIGGLAGEWWVSPNLLIYKNTKPISVESAELRTERETFIAEIYKRPPAKPNENGYDLPITWDFKDKRAAPRVLGNHCEIILKLKVGSEVREINIEYENTGGA